MPSKSNICCIFNYPPHYRYNIYKLMEEELDCYFYFGNIEEGTIKKLDYSLFRKPIKNLKTIRLFSGFNWIKGAVPLVFKPYDKFIMVGEPYCLSTWMILILNKLSNKKTFLWTHGWYGHEGKLKTFIKKTFFGLSDHVLLYGNYAKKLMIEEGFKEEKLDVVYNSLDYDKQLQIRKHLRSTTVFRDHFQNDYPVIIFTGRLTSVKKIDQLVKAHQILWNKGVRMNVLLLGDGPLSDDLKKQVEESGLNDNYWFYGQCYDEEKIGEFYYNAAVCVSPGNVGLTAIHSLMYGCPVISHSDFTRQMPEFEAIKPGITGEFFEYDNPDSLAQTIELWLHNHKEKTDALRNDCFRIIDERFNPHYQIKVLKETLESTN